MPVNPAPYLHAFDPSRQLTMLHDLAHENTPSPWHVAARLDDAILRYASSPLATRLKMHYSALLFLPLCCLSAHGAEIRSEVIPTVETKSGTIDIATIHRAVDEIKYYRGDRWIASKFKAVEKVGQLPPLEKEYLEFYIGKTVVRVELQTPNTWTVQAGGEEVTVAMRPGSINIASHKHDYYENYFITEREFLNGKGYEAIKASTFEAQKSKGTLR